MSTASSDPLTPRDRLNLERFVLYGTEIPLCRCDRMVVAAAQKLTEAYCPTLVRLVKDGHGGRALGVIETVIKSTVPYNEGGAGYHKAAACLAIVICTRAQDDAVKRLAYDKIQLICSTSEDFFLFHYYFRNHRKTPVVDAAGSSKAPPKKSGGSSGLKKAMRRWYNSRDPMELAVDSAATVNRYGENHFTILKDNHVKPDSKAIEVVMTYMALQKRKCGKNGKRGKNNGRKTLLKFNKKFENNEELDDKGQRILSYFKKLSRLGLLSVTEKLNRELRMRRQDGEEACHVAAILSDIRVPLLNGVPTTWWKSPTVMRALVPKMSARQILRHLPRLSDCGLAVATPPDASATALQILMDKDKLAAEKIDPFEVIVNMRRFESGRFPDHKLRQDGPKMKANTRIRPLATRSWEVTAEVVTACCIAYGLTLQILPPLDLTVLVAVDASAKMKDTLIPALTGLHAADIACVMVCMLKNAAKEKCKVVAFSSKSTPVEGNDEDFVLEPHIVDVDVKTSDTPTGVLGKIDPILSGPVNVGALLDHATASSLKVDAFLVMAGSFNTPVPASEPREALARYREAVNPNAKLAVVGAASRMFATAAPADTNHVDFLGFGLTTPRQIMHFLTNP